MNTFSIMKAQWWTYNHCLFIAYLASVTIGCGWISDTKIQKLSDKDWICKNCGYGSGVKNQYPLTSGTYEDVEKFFFQ